MLSTKRSVAIVALVLVVLVAVFWRGKPVAPPDPKLPTIKPATVVSPPAAMAVEAPARVSPPPAAVMPMGMRMETRGTRYSSAIIGKVSVKYPLDGGQRLALQELVNETRGRVYDMLAKTATVKRLDDGSVTVSASLDAATAGGLEQGFYSALQAILGVNEPLRPGDLAATQIAAGFLDFGRDTIAINFVSATPGVSVDKAEWVRFTSALETTPGTQRGNSASSGLMRPSELKDEFGSLAAIALAP